MNQHYVARRKPEWDELQKLVLRARAQLSSLSAEELNRLDVLYRRTTVTLAQVATRTRDAELIRYLNDLTAAAHAIIYSPPRKSVRDRLMPFVTDGFARAVVRTGRFQLAAALLLLLGMGLAYEAVQRDPAAAYALMMPGDDRQFGSTREQLEESLRHGREEGQGGKFLFASFLFQNNLRVALLAMASGTLAGIPTVFLLLYNGAILGSFTAIHHRAGIFSEYWAWILPHGVTELGAISLCGGVGLLLGYALVCPGRYTRPEALRRAGLEALRICGGVALMMALAAVIESFLRQSYLPTWSRLAFAAGTFVFWTLYFYRGWQLEKTRPPVDPD